MTATLETFSLPFTLHARCLVRLPRVDDGAGDDPFRPLPLFLALHGQGMTADLQMRLLGLPEDAPRIVAVPEGPYPFEKRGATAIEIGHAWYMYRGDQDEFRDYLERTEEHLLAVVDAVRARRAVDTSRSVILGYSQGGYVAGFVALRHKAMFRGLVLAGTRLKHEFLADEIAAGELPAVLAVHSESDPGIRWEAARASLDVIERAGAEVEVHLHDEGHRLPANLGTVVEGWLARRGFARG